MPKIIRDGFFFRALNEATGFRSHVFTSANQAGLLIRRKYGAEAEISALDAYLDELATSRALRSKAA